MEGVEEGVEDSARLLFDVIGSRCRLPQSEEEEELLVAVQRAMTELTEWHDALSLKDMMATCGRAVTTNATSYLQPVMLSEALVSAAAVPHGSVTGGSCRLSSEGLTADRLRNIGIELVMCERPVGTAAGSTEGAGDVDGAQGGPSQGWDLWGGSSCLAAAQGMEWQQATTLAHRVERAMASRLQTGTCWEAAGLPRDTRKAVAVHVEATSLKPADESAADAAGAVRVQMDVDARMVACEKPEEWQERLDACLDTVVTACMDLIRCASGANQA